MENGDFIASVNLWLGGSMTIHWPLDYLIVYCACIYIYNMYINIYIYGNCTHAFIHE